MAVQKQTGERSPRCIHVWPVLTSKAAHAKKLHRQDGKAGQPACPGVVHVTRHLQQKWMHLKLHTPEVSR